MYIQCTTSEKKSEDITCVLKKTILSVFLTVVQPINVVDSVRRDKSTSNNKFCKQRCKTLG